jgi:hypothetical protein
MTAAPTFATARRTASRHFSSPLERFSPSSYYRRPDTAICGPKARADQNAQTTIPIACFDTKCKYLEIYAMRSRITCLCLRSYPLPTNPCQASLQRTSHHDLILTAYPHPCSALRTSPAYPRLAQRHTTTSDSSSRRFVISQRLCLTRRPRHTDPNPQAHVRDKYHESISLPSDLHMPSLNADLCSAVRH